MDRRHAAAQATPGADSEALTRASRASRTRVDPTWRGAPAPARGRPMNVSLRIAVLLFLSVSGAWAGETAGTASAAPPMTAQDALRALREGNARFVADASVN